MDESSKLSMVYRLRPVKILPGVYYKITRQRGAKISFVAVPTDNQTIARNLAQLRYPELCEVMQVMIATLCDTLGNETCMAASGSQEQRRIPLELSRVIACLQGACAHLSILNILTLQGISSHEQRVRPIPEKQA